MVARCVFSILLSLVIVIQVQADPKEWLAQKKELQALQKKNKYLGKKETAITGLYQQRLNHLDAKDNRTFQQRHWVDSSYASGPAAPVLLYICGEGECGSWALGGAIAKHAAKLKAHMVALEHRYYGQSQPFSDLRTENLRYLSIEQALSDLLAYKKYLQTQNGWTGSWLAVGGSYSGALAAYLRSQYPHEFVGALSSSGPVLPKVDFSEYDRHVAQQAGAECLVATQKVVAEIESALSDAGRLAAIKTQFQAEVLRDADDFLYLVADTAAAAVQYGMKDRFCEKVSRRGLDGYAEAAEMVAGIFGNLVQLSAQAAEDTSLASGTIGMRQWFYQSCTQFGFFQNAWHEPALRSRSARINSEYHAQVCRRLFNMELPDVSGVAEKYYAPLLTSETTNILYTNGSQDPWLNLSVAPQNGNDVNPHTPTFILNGYAHCDDLGRKSGAPVAEAQSLFQDLAAQWISQGKGRP